MISEAAKTMMEGMSHFSERIKQKKRLYLKLLKLAENDSTPDKVFRIKDKKLLQKVLHCFGAALEQKKAKADLSEIYEAGIHKETGALILNNKGATLYSLSPKTETPAITRHIGFCVYMPGLGIEFVNVGLFGEVYDSKIVLRSESACTPSFIFGSQRCNCAHQWDSARELAAQMNKVKAPRLSDGRRFEQWVQQQFVYKKGKHLARNKGPGFVLMHADTQNGMGSGYTDKEFAFDLFSRASIRHRGEYSSEQIMDTTMSGGFRAIGITPDPRCENGNVGYKITFMILDYLGVSKEIIFLTNNERKIGQLKNNGYTLHRVKSLGAVNLAGAQEAEQRRTEFGHVDIDGSCVSFDKELARLKEEIKKVGGMRTWQ